MGDGQGGYNSNLLFTDFFFNFFFHFSISLYLLDVSSNSFLNPSKISIDSFL